MAMLRAQAAPTPLVAATMHVLMQAKQQAEANPDQIITTALGIMTTADLQQMQVSMTNGNADHKIGVLMKKAFGAQWTQIEELRKQLLMTEQAMKDMTHMMLLSQYGEESDASISWNKLAGEIVRIASNPPAPAAPAAAAPPANGLGM